MTLACPACGHRFEAWAEHDEKGSYCPKCGHGFLGGYV